MAYQLTEYTDPRAFHDAVIPHLLDKEAECCAQIGLIRRMMPNGYSPVSAAELPQPLLWTIHNDSRLELVAIQTLKKSMIVTRAPAPALEHLAQALAKGNWSGTELTGVSPSIEALVEPYATLTRRPRKLTLRLRVFQLDRVQPPIPSSGQMRLCRPDDCELLATFIDGFESDTGERSEETALARADRLIAEGRIFFWVDSVPVAIAAFAGPTPNGIRVNWVYTPPDFRRRGYASNLVAHLTQRLLDEGRKFCFLFTDQANPTSNSIYQKIGYRPIADSERWEFGSSTGVSPVSNAT